MKKYLLILFFLILMSVTHARTAAVASTPIPSSTPSATPELTITATPSSELKIQELKDKLASRVAQLAVVSVKLVSGEIKTLSDEKIVIQTDNGEINISLKDDTQIQSISSDFKKKSIKIDTLKSGQKIYSWGTLNSSTNTLSAKTVSVIDETQNLTGVIKSVDVKNYQLTIIANGKELLIDHQIDTKDYLSDPAKGLIKSGFSKFSPNQTVYVVGVYDEKGVMISALRIIALPSDNQNSPPAPTSTPAK